MSDVQMSSMLVSTGLESIQGCFRTVEDWSEFLLDVRDIAAVAPDRYEFTVVGSGSRESYKSVVAVREDTDRHSFVWGSVSGPHVAGRVQLKAEPDGWTRVDVTVSCWPQTLMAGVVEAFVPTTALAGVDLKGLRRLIERPRPSVLEPTGRAIDSATRAP